MNKLSITALALALVSSSSFFFYANAFSTTIPQSQKINIKDSQLYASTGRREMIGAVFGTIAFGITASSGGEAANALDMDAFMNSELESDKKNCDPKRDPKCIPKLTEDEALCKYGQSGNARGEACKRVKQAGGELPGQQKVKSLGGAYAM